MKLLLTTQAEALGGPSGMRQSPSKHSEILGNTYS